MVEQNPVQKRAFATVHALLMVSVESSPGRGTSLAVSLPLVGALAVAS